MNIFATILVFIVLIFVGILFFSGLYIVNQQTVSIVERFGKFKTVAHSGINFKIPYGVDRVVSTIPLRLLQAELEIETKTKDNVFVLMNVATQYRVNENNITDAYYKLMYPEAQIQSYIEDALRSAVPKLTLDEVFEKKDDIAIEVREQVAQEMDTYGYIIVKTLITRVDPDPAVKKSMNEINAAQRTRMAAQELAEADKIKVVTAAEAEAEKDRLHGVGIASQRKAIVDGLSDSIQELKDNNTQISEKEILTILLTNQYLDTLNKFSESNNSKTIFLPSSPSGLEDIKTQLISALEVNSK